MEQNNYLFQFVVGQETFTFEAANEKVAEMSRKYAMLHFEETLGKSIAENQISGPIRVLETHSKKAA